MNWQLYGSNVSYCPENVIIHKIKNFHWFIYLKIPIYYVLSVYDFYCNILMQKLHFTGIMELNVITLVIMYFVDLALCLMLQDNEK